MHLDLLPMGRAQDELLRNLYQFYMYDFSEFMGWDAGVDGRFGADDISDCWTNPQRFQLLIQVDGNPAGFALIQVEAGDGADEVDMREFFVMRAYRKRGVGEFAARRSFDRFRGRWTVFELRENKVAQAFWRKVIGKYTGGRYEEKTLDRPEWPGVMQTFDNSGR